MSKKKKGRPSIFSDALALTICERLAGGESLRQICEDADMPAKSTVMKWALENKDFSDQYARARALLMEHWSDDLIDIADDGTNDYVQRTGDDGEVISHSLNNEHIQRSKLRVDTRKWIMSKLAPKRYGDKTTSVVEGPDGGPVQVKLNYIPIGKNDNSSG